MLEQCCNCSKQCRNNVATLCCAKNRRKSTMKNLWQTAADEFYHTGFSAGGPFSPPACRIPGKRGLCQHEINHRKHLWRNFFGRLDIVFWSRILPFFIHSHFKRLMMKKQFMRNIQKRTKECQLRFIFIFLISIFFKNIYFLVLFRLSAVCQCFSLLIYHFNKTISELFQPPYVNVRNMRKVNFLNWYQCFF